MLIRDNFRRQFYDVIRKDHVLLIAHNDVDALCAAQIFIHLFDSDDVAFSLVTVTGSNSLDRAIRDNANKYNFAVLINCGGSRPLADIPDSMKIFIIDSLRPFDLDNVFAEENIHILISSAELSELAIPDVNDIYQSESESSDEEVDETRASLAVIEKRALKRNQKKQWEKRRADLIWEYYEKSWYSVPSSVVLLEIAHEVGKSCAELMWCAVIGFSSQLMDSIVSLEAYTQVCIDRLRPFIRQFSSRKSELKGDDLLRISFDKELPLPMYSHWSLYKSMANHDFFVCLTRYWQQRGDNKMRALLATLGLTLSECNQMYKAMNHERRAEVFDILQKKINSNFASFTAVVGYSKRIHASDFARVISYRLEVGPNDETSVHDRFISALNIINRFFHVPFDLSPFWNDIDPYKSCLEAVTSLVFSSINQNQVFPTGPFFLLRVRPSEHVRLLASRHFLLMFANFVLKVFCAMGWKNAPFRPLIVSVPLQGDDEGWLKITGIMPLNTVYADVNYKSFIGRAFQRVIDRLSDCVINQDLFDPAMILVKAEDQIRFFDGLQAVLETIA